ncbi:hypothetical protein FE257_005330 [Aspergillus nanangensis]|uniref:Uncharacterized protein n=1 Tax=Aspergillus nanangensis TaxID=2582783 RepID=A0AAD4CA85_ASPNN|nr:hypothetical protein FE257_005330 [Aspergillus nanangensis]
MYRVRSPKLGDAVRKAAKAEGTSPMLAKVQANQPELTIGHLRQCNLNFELVRLKLKARPTTPSISSTQSPSNNSTSQSPSNNPTSQSSGHGNRVSNGAFAGAIVGSIAGTVILTLLLAFLFYRRRRKSAVVEAAENKSDSSTKSGAITSTNAIPAGKQLSFSLAAITPHPADDETVHNRILTLIDHATLHVDNYYASNSPPVHLTQDAVALLGKYDSPFLPEPLVTILQGQRGNHRQVIAHALVYTMLRGIQPGGELLPKVLAAQHAAEAEVFSPLNEEALFAWRMITAYLYNQSTDKADYTHTSARTQAAQALAADFTSAFSPYALRAFADSDRMRHLANLAISTAELGVWLFSQPCTFEFVWKHGQTDIAVTPEVRKTFDEHGIRLATPQILIEAF